MSDLEAAVAMWADPTVTRFIGGKPSTPQQTWMRVLGYAGHWAMLGFGYWAIEENSTAAFIGEIGFADFKREIAASMRDVPELGWALVPIAHGKGYATEAALAALQWGDRVLPARRTLCLIDPENLASLRIAEKCGFIAFENASFNGRPSIFLERVPR
jgi:RimJ/RimL family protein N-acetyltransferase